MLNRVVLVADTNLSVCDVLRHILGLRGYTVVHAGDGAEALALARAQTLAAAVVDLHLPAASGLDVCRALRTQHPQLPVWITSGGCHPATALRAKAAGARGVVRKPFRPVDMCRRIELAMTRNRPAVLQTARY